MKSPCLFAPLFFTSSSVPFLIFCMFHMGSLYVLMSKSDHLHYLECVFLGFFFSLLRALCPGAFTPFSFLLNNIAYGFLTRPVFFCSCLLFVFSQETHQLRSSAASPKSS